MAGRLQCYSCIEGSCEVSDDTAKYCDVYGSDEKCVTVFATNEDAVVARGCSSEVNYQTVCDNSVGNCLQCGYDKCNIDDSKLKNRITCKTCVGSACMSSEIGEKVCSFYSQVNPGNFNRSLLSYFLLSKCLRFLNFTFLSEIFLQFREISFRVKNSQSSPQIKFSKSSKH